QEEANKISQSWEAIMKKVDTLDNDLVQGYKEDIDTLLVFAGLFSSVVTAFTVESYQWLKEDPADRNVVLLTQITQQLSGQALSLSPPLPFTPSSSAVRINTFWFLSLTLGLVDALFGLLCKQWLREHQRQTNTQTPGQALALHWLRYQSFEQWHVPKILASLPILLEVALFLFFAGLLELLWTLNPIPFAVALTIVGLGVLFYLTTTILPGVSIIQQVFQTHPNFKINFIFHPHHIPHLPAPQLICPYKSPQSWIVLHLLAAMYQLLGYRTSFYSLIVKFNPFCNRNRKSDRVDSNIKEDISSLSGWPSLDLLAIQRFSKIRRCPDLYELKGFRWLVKETRDTPSMVPHLKNVLGKLPLHLVMPTVFDRWDSPVGK
ncbi:hypothetical protein L218DRAFT_834273, partial [Marasmius fiardii PR-910]